MHREARQLINTMIDTLEQLVVIHMSDQINKGRDEGVAPHQYGLTPRRLDELHIAGAELAAAVCKRRWKASVIMDVIDRYLEVLSIIIRLYKEDHPERNGGWVFCPRKGTIDMSTPKKWPRSRVEMLRLVASRRRSIQFILINECGYGQSTVSEALAELEASGFINQEKIRPILEGSPPTVREKEITLTGAGKTVCAELFGKKFAKHCIVDMEYDERDHLLFINLIAVMDEVQAESRYYGETASGCRVHSSSGGGCYILPDLIAMFDHQRSRGAGRVPIEAEYKSNITAFNRKAKRYLHSDEDRVVIICRNKDMARKYMDFLHKDRRFLTSDDSRQVMFEFFYMAWTAKGYALVRVGSIILG